ncbi:EexN family lipoprotein [Brucella anthropi]|uniref:EexN family lipoprotein n=1 Tax=Brucella anthropi TaxID=529 RepID=UPI00235FD927|nr:EexN family lipoprotein [Brucella anthropi]
MRALVTMAVLGLLAGCSDDIGATYTLEELTADKHLLSLILSECRNNPGYLGGTRNCVNAQAADGRLRLRNMREALRN